MFITLLVSSVSGFTSSRPTVRAQQRVGVLDVRVFDVRMVDSWYDSGIRLSSESTTGKRVISAKQAAAPAAAPVRETAEEAWAKAPGTLPFLLQFS